MIKVLSPEKTFTQRFKILLLQHGLMQKDLAEKVGISEFLLSHIITGKRRGLPYRQKICKILDVSEKELWNGNK
jgi:DNA-binding Xre family transcriptional regulator